MFQVEVDVGSDDGVRHGIDHDHGRTGLGAVNDGAEYASTELRRRVVTVVS